MYQDIITNLLSGAIAGSIADLSTHPLSTIKTRLQCQGASSHTKNRTMMYSGPITALSSIIRQEGILSLYKGVGIVIASAAPAQALYFLGYESCKVVIGTESIASSFIAGCNAQLFASCIWVPMDVVKERLQVEGQLKTIETFGSSTNAIRQIIKVEGVRGLYRAYWLHQMTWMPYNGIYFSCYDGMKSRLHDMQLDMIPKGIITNIIAGIFAGTIASIITSPLDLVKTRLQVQQSNPTIFDYHGPIDATIKIIKREGIKALFDGVLSRILWLTPRFLIAMSTYDYVKNYFQLQQQQQQQQ